ncbi:hypothetical protein [Streptantibioticus ferralitis]|uniref:Uncharacterized protein n=1 Tax=Streptantibioticus ferralitis TaxID=236510 RepID=A0ABT5YVI1_9ACTN|nr:hypothetical protein [Streptantibioticus ferralitis]MDF2255612.1 hypothetical protein [Streptantibioticus ferralitis]
MNWSQPPGVEICSARAGVWEALRVACGMPHLPAEVGATLAARHVAVYLHGLRPEGAHPLPGAAPAPKDLGRHLAMDQRDLEENA